jgi:hypothetical protein
MRRSRLAIMKPYILDFFDNEPTKVYRASDLTNILEAQRESWELPISLTFHKFSEFFSQEGKLRSLQFKFLFQPTTLFEWGDASINEIAMAIRPRGYLSHLSALRYHAFSDQPGDEDEKIIYINDEQKEKPKSSGRLEQLRIDAAFKRPVRKSNNRVDMKGYTFYQLSGMHTNQLGVIEVQDANCPVPIRVTKPERSLIDATVRPIYSGGPANVLEAFRRAAGEVDVEAMLVMLQEMSFVYPYHQAIGFYLERAGVYNVSTINAFHSLPREFDFYLDYGMVESRYSQDWRLYYPAELD